MTQQTKSDAVEALASAMAGHITWICEPAVCAKRTLDDLRSRGFDVVKKADNNTLARLDSLEQRLTKLEKPNEVLTPYKELAKAANAVMQEAATQSALDQPRGQIRSSASGYTNEELEKKASRVGKFYRPKSGEYVFECVADNWPYGDFRADGGSPIYVMHWAAMQEVHKVETWVDVK